MSDGVELYNLQFNTNWAFRQTKKNRESLGLQFKKLGQLCQLRIFHYFKNHHDDGWVQVNYWPLSLDTISRVCNLNSTYYFLKQVQCTDMNK